MVQNKLVKISTTRLLSDVLMNDFLRQVFKRHSISQRFAATLKRERNVNVADGESLPVDGAQSDAPIVGVDASQLRNVRCNLAVSVAFALPVNFFNVLGEAEKVWDDKLVTKCARDENDVRLDDAVDSHD